jgi:hypothetical protein
MRGAPVSASELARLHTDQAIETIAYIMENGIEDKDRLRAAESLLDRGHGKAAQAIIAVPANRQQAAMLAALSDDELMQAIQSTRLPRLAPIEAEFTIVPSSTKDDPLLK